MTYDPTPAYGQEQRRSGPRWYSVVAFLVIAFLLAVNALAIFANAEANSEQACWVKANALADAFQNRTDGSVTYLAEAVNDCLVRFPTD